MKLRDFAACAALLLAACGQSTAPAEEEAPAAPQGLMEEVQAMSPENQPVFAYQQLTAYQATHPEATPPCTAIRGAESRGVVPADVDPNSIYAAHVGSLVLSVQCGALVSRAAMDPQEHWLVVLAPGATEATIVNCAAPAGGDACPVTIPRAPAAAPATP